MREGKLCARRGCGRAAAAGAGRARGAMMEPLPIPMGVKAVDVMFERLEQASGGPDGGSGQRNCSTTKSSHDALLKIP